MRIGQLVEMIRKADPTGEAFIMDDEFSVPRFFESKEGYWDGAYYYIDEQGRYVKEDKEYKVDVHDNTLNWLVWEQLDYELTELKHQAVLDGGVYVLTKEKTWELLTTMVTFESDVPTEFRDDIMARLKEEFDKWGEFRKKSDGEWIEKAVEESKNGYQFFEPKDHEKNVWKMTKNTNLLGMTYDALRKLFKGKDYSDEHDGVCFGMIEAIITSGKFERISYDENWWQWRQKQ